MGLEAIARRSAAPPTCRLEPSAGDHCAPSSSADRSRQPTSDNEDYGNMHAVAALFGSRWSSADGYRVASAVEQLSWQERPAGTRAPSGPPVGRDHCGGPMDLYSPNIRAARRYRRATVVEQRLYYAGTESIGGRYKFRSRAAKVRFLLIDRLTAIFRRLTRNGLDEENWVALVLVSGR